MSVMSVRHAIYRCWVQLSQIFSRRADLHLTFRQKIGFARCSICLARIQANMCSRLLLQQRAMPSRPKIQQPQTAELKKETSASKEITQVKVMSADLLTHPSNDKTYLRTGTYLTDGTNLFRILSYTRTGVTLEDCMTLQAKWKHLRKLEEMEVITPYVGNRGS